MRRACLLAPIVAAMMVAPVLAKLPAPSDEAKAKAAEAATKTAWSDKVSAYKLCLAMDRAATHYRVNVKAALPAVETPVCADPGPFVPPVPVAAAASAVAASGPAKQ